MYSKTLYKKMNDLVSELEEHICKLEERIEGLKNNQSEREIDARAEAIVKATSIKDILESLKEQLEDARNEVEEF